MQPANEAVDIAIVGGGIAGLATAYFAARSGRSVVLLERDPILASQSSGKNAAILRTVIDDPRLREIAQASARFLLDPPAGFCDAPLVDPCGLLLTADEARAEALLAWAADGWDSQIVDAERVAQVAPRFIGERAAAVWLPHEGRLDIALLAGGFARGARAAGAELRTGASVEALLTEGSSVCGVRLAGGEELTARQTVLAAGGWAGQLGARHGSRVRLQPTRRHLAVTPPDSSVDPRGPIVWSSGDAFYYRPESGGLLISACDQTAVDPDHCDVDPEVRQLCLEKAERNLSPQPAGIAHFWCAMRTLTEDGRFAVGPDPDLEGLFWAAGLGGHGMVCSAELGRLAAESLARGTAAAGLDPARLTTKSELLSP